MGWSVVLKRIALSGPGRSKGSECEWFWIDEQVKSGKFANASDYIRDLVRRNQGEREAINLALIEGELSGESSKNVLDILKEKN